MKPSKILKKILSDDQFVANSSFTDKYIDHLESTGKLSLNHILKDKSFMRTQRNVLKDLKDDYIKYLDEDAPDLKPKCKARQNYIGIEIECFTRYDRFQLIEKIMEYGLDKMVQPVGDGSIEPDFGDEVELRVLIPETSLKHGLKKVDKLFVKNKFGVNESCGLHIHLDMRNRNMEKCYQKLLKFQDVLFSMVDKERWDNNFCKFTSVGPYDRYVAINKSTHHNTIEIRLHHATLDVKLIEKWINLLLRIINSTKPPKISTKADVLKWAKKQPKMVNAYVQKHFNEQWFERKKVASGGDDEGYF